MKFRVNARTDEATISFDTSEDGTFATTVEKLLISIEDAERSVKEGATMGATMGIVIPSFTIEIEVFDPGEGEVEVSWLGPTRDEEHKVRVLADRGTAEECEQVMRTMTNGERGCANPEEHAS